VQETPSSGAASLRTTLAAGAAAVLLPLACYALLALELPVLTEARDYIHHGGWVREGPYEALLRILEPTGQNTRYVSMLVFAGGKALCGYDARCVNALQLSLLGLGGGLIFLHLHQLTRRRFEPLLVTLLWFGAFATRSAAFWQATQHDKLALVFIVAALVTASAFRRTRGPWSMAAANLCVLVPTVLALNAKEIAFALPVMLVAQALLLPRDAVERRHALGRVAAPALFGLAFAAVYLARMPEFWRDHVGGGDWTHNLSLLARLAVNLPPDRPGTTWLYAPTLAVLAWALWRGRASPPRLHEPELRAALYLLAVAVLGVATALLTRHPDAYYLLTPAFGGCGAAVLLFGRLLRGAGLGGAPRKALLAALFLPYLLLHAGELRADRSAGRFLARTAHAARGLDEIARHARAHAPGTYLFVFATKPREFFYLFRGGADGGDPLTMNFALETGGSFRVSHQIGLPAPPPAPDQLVAIWDEELRLVDLELGGAAAD